MSNTGNRWVDGWISDDDEPDQELEVEGFQVEKIKKIDAQNFDDLFDFLYEESENK